MTLLVGSYAASSRTPSQVNDHGGLVMVWYLILAVGLVLAVVWMGWAVADSAYRVFKEINEREDR